MSTQAYNPILAKALSISAESSKESTMSEFKKAQAKAYKQCLSESIALSAAIHAGINAVGKLEDPSYKVEQIRYMLNNTRMLAERANLLLRVCADQAARDSAKAEAEWQALVDG